MTVLRSDTRTDSVHDDIRTRPASNAGRAAVCWAIAAIITMFLSGVLVQPMDSARSSTPAVSEQPH
ncbi:MAG: hypothetical protein QM674_06165 [Burkholderiaceae bacterium]